MCVRGDGVAGDHVRLAFLAHLHCGCMYRLGGNRLCLSSRHGRGNAGSHCWRITRDSQQLDPDASGEGFTLTAEIRLPQCRQKVQGVLEFK